MCFDPFIVQPSITPFEFGEEAVDSGEMVSILCTVSKGDLPINISWLLNNRNVNQHSGISIIRTNNRISQLSIDSVQEEHSGLYECAASNLAGIARHSARLSVNGINLDVDLSFLLLSQPKISSPRPEH